MVDFVRELPMVCKPNDPTSIIVLDNAHWLSRSPLLKSLLQAREHCHGGASIAFVLISQQAWGCGEFEDLSTTMPMVHFPAYSKDQLTTILIKIRSSGSATSRAPPMAQNHFVVQIVAAFYDTTRDLLDLATLADHLWPRYLDPIQSGKLDHEDILQLPPHSLIKRLYTPVFIKHVQAARQVFEPGMRRHMLPTSAADKHQLQQSQILNSISGDRVSHEQTLELPDTTRLLLVAAYIVAQNKPTLDKQIFDVKAKSGRARSRMDSDRQVEAAKESRLKGPHPFPLQRLLTCLSYLQSGREVNELELVHGGGRASSSSGLYAFPHDSSSSMAVMFRERDERDRKKLRLGMDIDFTLISGTNNEEEREEEKEDGDIAPSSPLHVGRKPWWKRQKRDRDTGHGGSDHNPGPREGGDLFAHLHTLTRMQLLSSSDSDASDVLEGAKYSCHISEEYASNLASSLGLRLTDYVKYA